MRYTINDKIRFYFVQFFRGNNHIWSWFHEFLQIKNHESDDSHTTVGIVRDYSATILSQKFRQIDFLQKIDLTEKTCVTVNFCNFHTAPHTPFWQKFRESNAPHILKIRIH